MNEQKYLESIVLPLLSHPEDLKIEHTVDARGVLLEISANSEDMGRLIGKAGCTASALRLLMKQFGGLNQMNISVKIKDPEGYVPRSAYKPTSDKELMEE